MSIIYFRASNNGLDQPKSGPSDANTELTASAIIKRFRGLLLVLAVGSVISGSSATISHRLTLREYLADLELPEPPKSQVSTAHDELSDAPTFHVGEIVEQIYNDYSRKVRILYPYQVEEIHSSGDIRYTIVRLEDGLRLEKLPESSLRQYLPYEIDTLALCNVGGHGKAQQLHPCFVQEYTKEEKEYRVRIDGEEHNLSIEMMVQNVMQRHS